MGDEGGTLKLSGWLGEVWDSLAFGWEKQPLSHVSSRTGKDYEGYIPLWFERKVDAVTGELICVYKGGYWEAKDKQDWSTCPDIF